MPRCGVSRRRLLSGRRQGKRTRHETAALRRLRAGHSRPTTTRYRSAWLQYQDAPVAQGLFRGSTSQGATRNCRYSLAAPVAVLMILALMPMTCILSIRFPNRAA